MMMLTAFVSAVLLSTTFAQRPLNHNSQYKSPPIPYEFSYGVKDEYAGTDFNQQESSNGNLVQGSYSVQLPDGRKQIVTYEADHVGGYNADVKYEGNALYPSHGAAAITFAPNKYHR